MPENPDLHPDSAGDTVCEQLPGIRIVKRRIRITPSFSQTDMMGVIHNAQYFKWFEDGRLQIMIDVLPFDEAIERGFLFPVIENRCRYRKFVRFGDTLVLTTMHTILTTYNGNLQFSHSLAHEKTKEEMACGESVITILDRSTSRLIKDWPSDIWTRYLNLK